MEISLRDDMEISLRDDMDFYLYPDWELSEFSVEESRNKFLISF